MEEADAISLWELKRLEIKDEKGKLTFGACQRWQLQRRFAVALTAVRPEGEKATVLELIERIKPGWTVLLEATIRETKRLKIEDEFALHPGLLGIRIAKYRAGLLDEDDPSPKQMRAIEQRGLFEEFERLDRDLKDKLAGWSLHGYQTGTGERANNGWIYHLAMGALVPHSWYPGGDKYRLSGRLGEIAEHPFMNCYPAEDFADYLDVKMVPFSVYYGGTQSGKYEPELPAFSIKKTDGMPFACYIPSESEDEWRQKTMKKFGIYLDKHIQAQKRDARGRPHMVPRRRDLSFLPAAVLANFQVAGLTSKEIAQKLLMNKLPGLTLSPEESGSVLINRDESSILRMIKKTAKELWMPLVVRHTWGGNRRGPSSR